MTEDDYSDLFTEDQPLGPIDSRDISNSFFNAITSKRNFLYSEIGSNPSMIVGRKGSGKTTFLRLAHHDTKDKVIIELRPEDTFRQIVQTIEGFGKSIVLAEEASNIWKTLLWSLVFVSILKDEGNKSSYNKSNNFATIKKYVEAQGLQEKGNPYKIMQAVINSLRTFAKANEDDSISANIEKLTFQGITFDEAKDATMAFMKEAKIRALVLLDNLDDFPLDNETMSHAITGLLKCQGSFSVPGCRCTLRSCLPAELYFPFMDMSSAPLKDFQHRLVLHWHAAELLQLSAMRHLKYMEIHHKEFFKELAKIDIDSKAGVKDYWQKILPPTVVNKLGMEESSIAYILRHTQLLPRQILMFLNQICSEIGGMNILTLKERPEDVVRGIHSQEELLCEDVFRAFKHVHPSARSACQRCIPYLSIRFSEGDLVIAYKKHATDLAGIEDFFEFKKVLFEIGAIGIVTSYGDRYINGLFEYTAEHRLVSSSYDEFCLHPLFTEVFGAVKKNQKPVYPFGTDVNEPDWRMT